jgi:hypothetical protein
VTFGSLMKGGMLIVACTASVKAIETDIKAGGIILNN